MASHKLYICQFSTETANLVDLTNTVLIQCKLETAADNLNDNYFRPKITLPKTLLILTRPNQCFYIILIVQDRHSQQYVILQSIIIVLNRALY